MSTFLVRDGNKSHGRNIRPFAWFSERGVEGRDLVNHSTFSAEDQFIPKPPFNPIFLWQHQPSKHANNNNEQEYQNINLTLPLHNFNLKNIPKQYSEQETYLSRFQILSGI